VAAAIRALLAGTGAPFAREYPCHAPDGRRWFAVRVTPCVGAGPGRAMVAYEDITARRLAEERAALRAQLLDRVPAAVVATDPAGVVTHWNAAPASCWSAPRTARRVGPSWRASAPARRGPGSSPCGAGTAVPSRCR